MYELFFNCPNPGDTVDELVIDTYDWGGKTWDELVALTDSPFSKVGGGTDPLPLVTIKFTSDNPIGAVTAWCKQLGTNQVFGVVGGQSNCPPWIVKKP